MPKTINNITVKPATDMRGLALVVAVIIVGVITADVVLWLLHILVIVAEGLGFTVMAAVGIFGAVKWRQAKNDREVARQMARFYPAAAPAVRGQMPAALPAAGGDVHLHLPAGISADDVAVIMRQHRGGELP